MKHIKKILLALTAVAMMVVLLSTSAFAVSSNSGKKYVYTCFGDSVSAGYGLDGYNPDYGYDKFYWPTIEGSFPDLIRDAKGAKINQFAHSAYRTTDLRVLLDRSFTGDSMAGYRLPSVNNDERNIDWNKVEKYRNVVEKAVKASNLVTVEIGVNDSSMPALNATETFSDSLTSALSLNVPRVVKDVTFYGALAEGEINAFRLFSQNFDAIIQGIRNYNKTCKIVVIGNFNPMKDYKVPAGFGLPIGPFVDPIFQNQNNYMQNQCPLRDQYTYVDMTDVKTHMNDPESPMYGADFHPTYNGHRQIADRVLKVL
ncbi:MAG: hypothetical protein IJ241_03415 [Clostridia bacterium]|nr:hypothetical protein [Clostridia bacterium]MBQ8926229.1 hypothetical protein [Clostridia bacterium]